MAIKIYKPTSPGRRGMSVSTFDEITRSTPERSLLRPLRERAGRNNQGRVTVRHQGGGHKRMYRLIDFRRNKDGVPARVASIQYDPNRSARIALLHYADGEKRYIIAPVGLEVGAEVIRVGYELPVCAVGRQPLEVLDLQRLIGGPGRGCDAERDREVDNLH